jgi:acyl carrier protein
VLEAFCGAVNQIKRSGFTAQQLTPELYLGGDLGIDSIEMLEVWYELEKRLSVVIEDAEKRNIFTIDEVVKVVHPKL